MTENMNDGAAAPKRVVVIGAGGFVGGAIADAARARGYPVQAVGRGEVDLLSDGSGTALKNLVAPDDAVVFVSAHAPCKDYAMFEANIRMAKNALDGLAGTPLAQLLYISSDAVYSDSDAPLTEASVTAPDNLHGQMHVARETMFAAALAGANPDTVFATLRPTLIYGADDPHNGYGPNRFRRQVLAGDPVPLFGNGEERRDHVSVLDVAALALCMVEWRTRGAVNAATGRVASFRELAEMTFGFAGRPAEIENLPRSGPMPHNGYRPFDAGGVGRLFPDFAFTDLESGLREAYEEARAAEG